MKNVFWPKGMLAAGLLLSMTVALSAAKFHQAENLTGSQLVRQTNSIPPQPLQALLRQLDERLARDSLDYEASLFKAMLYFNSGSLQEALDEIEQLTQRAPDFHLAQLVKGDMLMSRFGPVSDIGASPLLQDVGEQGREKLQQLRDEAEARLRAMIQIQQGDKVPEQLLGLGSSIETAILVEKKYNRLYVFGRSAAGGPPHLIRDYYVSTGKKPGNKHERGDLRTPEGVYFVTSWIPDEKLPAKYGIGAFPVNYPNELDRKLGKTGDGIWLHGTDPEFYSRPPLDSEGCVVLPNIDLSGLKEEIVPGETPVVITEQATWVGQDEWQNRRAEVLAALDQWRRDWESMDTEKYLRHYAADFWAKGHTYATWAARKRDLARHKTYQHIKLSDIALFAYPDKAQQPPLVVARFRQRYESNNYRGDIRKRIYLRKDGSQWRILYEGV